MDLAAGAVYFLLERGGGGSRLLIFLHPPLALPRLLLSPPSLYVT